MPAQENPLIVVAAVTQEWGLGNHGRLPWHPRRIEGDMAFLRHMTSGLVNIDADKTVTWQSISSPPVVIYGRATWESIPARFRPLEGRLNIIISRDPDYAK